MTRTPDRPPLRISAAAGTPNRTDLGAVLNSTPEPQTTAEERVARHLAAKDWLTTDDWWDTATASFRADYLAAAREVIALVQPAAVSVAVPPTTEDLASADNPTPLRWGLNDVLWSDDDSVIVLLSGPDGEPYWLELDPERAAVLRQDLAGPPAEQTALRDRIRRAICEAEGFAWDSDMLEPDEYGDVADMVLGVLPPAADRAAALRSAADELDGVSAQFDVDSCGCGNCPLCAWKDAARHLRRLAAEAPAPETQTAPCGCPHPADEHGVYGCADGCPCEWMPKRKPMDPVRILGIGAERDDPTQCSGEEDFCPEHGFHRHSLKKPAVGADASVHTVPLPGSNGISACCGRPPCEFVGERVTRDPDEVTCPGPAASAVVQTDEEA